jgi:hypothetical protein
MTDRRWFLKICGLSAVGALPVLQACKKTADRTPDSVLTDITAPATRPSPEGRASLPLPPIDAAAPGEFRTATFALG